MFPAFASICAGVARRGQIAARCRSFTAAGIVSQKSEPGFPYSTQTIGAGSPVARACYDRSALLPLARFVRLPVGCVDECRDAFIDIRVELGFRRFTQTDTGV